MWKIFKQFIIIHHIYENNSIARDKLTRVKQIHILYYLLHHKTLCIQDEPTQLIISSVSYLKVL